MTATAGGVPPVRVGPRWPYWIVRIVVPAGAGLPRLEGAVSTSGADGTRIGRLSVLS